MENKEKLKVLLLCLAWVLFMIQLGDDAPLILFGGIALYR